jgi:uncharacterized protein YwqG
VAGFLHVLKELALFALGVVAAIALAVLALVTAIWIGHRRERRRPPANGATTASSRLFARIKRAARPTLLFIPAKSPSFSKLGGVPDLPKGVDWPAGTKGAHAFLVQVDLAAVQAGAPIDWLPAEGRLYVFCDLEGYGWAEQVKVIYSAADPGPPSPLSNGAKAYRERHVDFMPFVSLPSLEWLNADDELDMDREAFDARLAAIGKQPPGEDLLHRIGGYPDEIQGGCLRLECEHLARGLPGYDYADEPPPAIDRASGEWRLLLQIDSDPELGMSFGDAGRFYVFIRERHARAADFSKTVTLFQCY